MEELIEISGLSKDYAVYTGIRRVNVRALDNVSFGVGAGEIFGLLGQNGAGKTTLIKLLMGSIFATSGSFKIFGGKPDQITRKRIGYLPENPAFPGHLRPAEVLRLFGRLYGIDGGRLEARIREVLDLVQLTNVEKKPVHTFSKGMTQRLGMAQALMNNPDLLILDEPSDGVDPIGRKSFRDILLGLKNERKTVFINSHILSEVELITDRVVILKQGKIAETGSVKELTLSQTGYMIRVEAGLNKIKQIAEQNYPNVKINNDSDIECRVDNADELNRVIDFLRGGNIMITEIYQQKRSLEDVYLRLMKEAG